MEQIKEAWNLVFNWIGNGKKMIMGGCFLIAGIIGQSMSEKTLAQIPFILMSMGVLCFVNALFSKITKKNINLLLFLLINILVTEVGITVMAADLFEGVTMIGVWCLCGVIVWILQTLILREENIPKRVVLTFFETLLSAVAILVVFVLPIFIEVWRGSR